MEQRIDFKGSGLNWDDDLNRIPLGDSRNRLDLEFVGNGDDTLRAILNRSNVTNSSLPGTGTNKIIGWCPDYENNAFFVFNYNSGGNHCIFRVSDITGIEDISTNESAWNFSVDYPIYDANVVGTGSDATLTWTDNYNPPRSINIANVLAGTHSTLNESEIDSLRPAPIYKPAVAIDTDTDYDTNNIRGTLFQFAYSYVYDNGQESAVSHWSDVLYNYKDEFADGAFILSLQTSNFIDLTLTVDHDSVSELKIYYRKADVGLGVPGDWYLYDTVTASTSTTSYSFYNDIRPIAIDQTEFLKLYDAVPRLAQHQEPIADNRIAYGGFTDGYDNIALDVALTAWYTSPDELSDQYTGFTEDYGAAAANIDSDIGALLTDGEENNITVYVSYFSNSTTFVSVEKYILQSDLNVSTGNPKDHGDVVDWFVAEINANTAYTITASNSSDTLRIANGYAGAEVIGVKCYVSKGDGVFYTFKANASHRFAICYYDKYDKSGRSQISTDTVIGLLNRSSYEDEVTRIRYSINHQAPSWAVCYQWMYGGSSISNFFQVPIDSTSGGDLSDDGVYTTFKVDDALSAVEAYNSKFIIGDGFTVQKGDRIRVMGRFSTYSGYMFVPLVTGEIDLEILGFDGNGDPFTQSISTFNIFDDILGNGNDYPYLIIEVYRNSSSIDAEDTLYYEVGSVLGVSSGNHHGSYHAGGATAQSYPTTPAEGEIIFGNVYRRTIRVADYNESSIGVSTGVPGPLLFSPETTYASLSYNSTANSEGRANYVDGDAGSKYNNSIIYGGVFARGDVNYNDLNRFSDADVKYVGDRYGGITGMHDMGDYLAVLMERNITIIEINRTRLNNADGSTQVVVSDTVLGTKNSLPYVVGNTLHDGGRRINDDVIIFDTHRFGWYVLRGREVIDITKSAKMRGYGRYLSDIINTKIKNGNTVHVITGHNASNDTYMFTYKNTDNDADDTTISYHLPSGRFLSFYSNTPECYAQISDNRFYHCASGEVYQEGVGPLQVNTGYVSIHFHVSPEERMSFDYLKLGGTLLWYPSTSGDILVDEDFDDHSDWTTLGYYGYNDDTAPTGAIGYDRFNYEMSSYIPEMFFKQREGEFVANFLRNTIDKNGSDDGVLYLHEGERLKGRSMRITLRSLYASTSRLKYVVVGYTKTM